jgi:hypothetical protein
MFIFGEIGLYDLREGCSPGHLVYMSLLLCCWFTPLCCCFTSLCCRVVVVLHHYVAVLQGGRMENQAVDMRKAQEDAQVSDGIGAGARV